MNAVFYFSVTTVSEKYATNKMCSNLAVILMRGLQKIQSDTRGNPLYHIHRVDARMRRNEGNPLAVNIIDKLIAKRIIFGRTKRTGGCLCYF